jgi:hypothetical protein
VLFTGLLHAALKKIPVQGIFKFGLILDLHYGIATFCFGVLASLGISLWVGSRAGEHDQANADAPANGAKAWCSNLVVLRCIRGCYWDLQWC